MRKIVFDIETTDVMPGIQPQDMDLAVVAVYDSETDEYTSYLENELQQLWPIIERADALIGFNSDNFDVPLLNKYYPGDLRTIKSIDLLEEIRKTLGRRIKLDKIAQGTLGHGKSSHGLKAVDWWKEGKIDKVRTYCIDDVRITKEIYDYAVKHQELKYKERNQIFPIKMDTSNWEEAGGSSMTHTMPF